MNEDSLRAIAEDLNYCQSLLPLLDEKARSIIIVLTQKSRKNGLLSFSQFERDTLRHITKQARP